MYTHSHFYGEKYKNNENVDLKVQFSCGTSFDGRNYTVRLIVEGGNNASIILKH